MSRQRRGTRAFGVLAAALLANASAAPAGAQTYRDLGDGDAAALIELHNAASTSRFAGEAMIAAGTELRGDVAILNGPLIVEGTLVGRVLVVNGAVRLEPGARIVGDLIVVGGDIDGAGNATVDGELIVYREALRYRRVGELIEAADPEPGPGLSAGRDFGFGRTSFSVAMAGAYNRVEGLPIVLGPRASLGSSNPTVFDASLIYRTAGGFTLEDEQVGYVLRAEQYVGGHGRVRLGATLRSEVLPIEINGVSDTESSLATFLLHRDYRDHYERRGWSGYARWTNERRALDATLEYRDEKHDARAAQSPWTLFDNGEPFRPQPLVADGSLRTIALRVEHDSRNEVRDPSSGWLVRFESEQGVGGRLALTTQMVPGGPLGRRDMDERFSALTIDARRYLRLGPLSRAAVRVWAAGSLDGGPLPPQRQHTLGGEGTMPGFGLMTLDCGARGASIPFDADSEFFPFYGCDRAVLGQANFEQTLPFIRPLGRTLGLDFDLGPEPALVLFADVGRAWVETGARNGRDLGTPNFEADAGIGLRFGRIGVYWAMPITVDDGEPNFFVRIGPRI